MKSLKLINPVSLAVIFLIAAQANYAQINIGGISIPRIKRPDKTKPEKPDVKPQPTPENSGTTSTTENSNTAQNTTDEPPQWWINAMLGDIKDAKADVDEYTPEGKIYLVRSTLSGWLLRAVSQKAREEFAKDKKFSEWRTANAGNKYDTALDALAASAAKKLPGYIPNAKNFALRDAALERMMKQKLKNAATLKIHKIGIFDANWRIERNSSGIPTSRYREAYIWGKDSADDFQYCHLYGVVLQQDYSGGGTFGATYAYINTDSLFGCPAN